MLWRTTRARRSPCERRRRHRLRNHDVIPRLGSPANEPCTQRCTALSERAPGVVHTAGRRRGGKKLSSGPRARPSRRCAEAGYPGGRAAYLEELGLPRHDVHLDLERIRSLSTDVLASLPDTSCRSCRRPAAAADLMRGATTWRRPGRSRSPCSSPQVWTHHKVRRRSAFAGSGAAPTRSPRTSEGDRARAEAVAGTSARCALH